LRATERRYHDITGGILECMYLLNSRLVSEAANPYHVWLPRMRRGNDRAIGDLGILNFKC